MSNKPENKMLIAILEVSKTLDNGDLYFKTKPFGLNNIAANLKNGKLYIELVKFPYKESINTFGKDDDILF